MTNAESIARPSPLTPPACDLRGLEFMPLHLQPLFDSDFFALSSGEEFKIGLTLWGKAWHEVPAASLPNDERLLAKKAGVSLEQWRSLAPMALHGWSACNDGRLYHSALARVAIKAWIERIGHQKRSAKGNATKSERAFNEAEFDALKEQALAFLRALTPEAPQRAISLKEADALPQGAPDDPSRPPSRPKKTSEVKGSEGKVSEGKRSESENSIFTIDDWVLDEACIEDAEAFRLKPDEIEAAALQHRAWWKAHQPLVKKTREGWGLQWRNRLEDIASDPKVREKLTRDKPKRVVLAEPPPLPESGPQWWLDACAKLRASLPTAWTSWWAHCTPAEEQGFVVAAHDTAADLMRNNGIIADATRLLGFELVVTAPPARRIA